jgi:hypothetical protein
MPSTWLLLVALTAGRALVDNLEGASEPAPAYNPDTGLFEPGTASDASQSMPGWLVALLIVAGVVTVLAALLFGWIGHTLARRQARDRTAEALPA